MWKKGKAVPTEKRYNRSTRDTSKTIFALVNLEDAKDVFINNIPIKELAEKNQE